MKDHLRNKLLSTSLSKLASEGLSLAKVDFDALLSLGKSMNPEGYLCDKRKERKQTKIAF